MADWTDRYWTSTDGLKLHYRDYAGSHERPPILCLPGLTRNARDFEPIADRYAGDWRVVAVDLRGRGQSERDPDSRNYAPPVYVADVMKLLDQLGIADAVFIGTSLGGLCTMLLASTDNERIAGAMLNDIGPIIDQPGIDRISGYVGEDSRFGSWDEVVAELGRRSGDVYPRWGLEEWGRFARRICVERDGEIAFDYDMAIADNFRISASRPQADAWPLFQALDGRPVTILRGETSDLLSNDTAERMVRAIGDAELVTVPAVGHTPTFEEPESQAAVDRLLERVLAV